MAGSNSAVMYAGRYQSAECRLSIEIRTWKHCFPMCYSDAVPETTILNPHPLAVFTFTSSWRHKNVKMRHLDWGVKSEFCRECEGLRGGSAKLNRHNSSLPPQPVLRSAPCIHCFNPFHSPLFGSYIAYLFGTDNKNWLFCLTGVKETISFRPCSLLIQPCVHWGGENKFTCSLAACFNHGICSCSIFTHESHRQNIFNSKNLRDNHSRRTDVCTQALLCLDWSKTVRSCFNPTVHVPPFQQNVE